MSEDTATLSPNPEMSVAANPSPEPASPSTGTVQTQNGQADPGRQTAPVEETFFTGDPKTLPPQLRQAYDNMLRDYKDKTGKLSEERKTLEAVKQKADAFDQLAGDQRFITWYNDLTKPQQEQVKSEMADDMGVSDEEMAAVLAGDKNALVSILKKFSGQNETQLKELLYKNQVSEASEIINAFAEAKDDKGKALHPNFEKLEALSLGSVDLISAFLQLDGQPAQGYDQYMQKMQRAYQAADKFYTQIYEEGRKAGLGLVQRKAMNATEAPAVSGPASVFTGDPKKLDARTAMRLAREGVVVPRD